MITRQDLEERVREWGLREDVVEKDYVLGWVLWGIGQHEMLSTSSAFKGGTCLKKCYIETYRFSEDLDFTVLAGRPIVQADLQPICSEIFGALAHEGGNNFSGRPAVFKTHASGQYTEGRIYTKVRGMHRRSRASSSTYPVLKESHARPCSAPSRTFTPETLPPPATVRCYAFEEVFAEKIRAWASEGDHVTSMTFLTSSDIRAQRQA